MKLEANSLLEKSTTKTRIGLRNPPHLIYKALQEHKQKMSTVLSHNNTNLNSKSEHFHKLRQQLESIEEEIKKLLAQDEESSSPPQQQAATRDKRQEIPKRRNSIGRSTNIAREIQTLSTNDFIPIHNKQQQERNKRRHRRKVTAASFPVPLSIPEGEEEHCLWSSCPSLMYEPEPRDLPPKLPTRR